MRIRQISFQVLIVANNICLVCDLEMDSQICICLQGIIMNVLCRFYEALHCKAFVLIRNVVKTASIFLPWPVTAVWADLLAIHGCFSAYPKYLD